MNKNNGKRTAQLSAFGAVLSFLLILLDQWTKALAVTKLKDQASFVILQGVFELHYLENHGATRMVCTDTAELIEVDELRRVCDILNGLVRRCNWEGRME